MTAVVRRHQRDLLLVLIAYAIFVLFGVSESAIGVAWPSMRQTLGLPIDALGAVLLTSSLAFMASSFSSGSLNMRFGISSLLLAAAVLRTVALLGYALAPTWGLIVAMAVLYGAGSGLLDSTMNTYFAARHSERLMNWLHASFGLGATVGPLIITAALSQNASWRWGYAVIAGLQALSVIGLLLTRKEWRAPSLESSSAARPGAIAGTDSPTWKIPIVWLGIANFFFFAGLEITAGQWSYSLFTEGRGISPEVAGLWVAIYWGSFTLGRLVFGFFADRLDLHRSVRVMLLVCIVTALLIWWNPSDLVSFVSLAVMGFALAPLFPLLTSDTPKRVGSRHAASAIGYQVGAASLGIGVMPAIAGVLARYVGLEVIGPYLVILATGAFVLHELLVRSRPEEG